MITEIKGYEFRTLIDSYFTDRDSKEKIPYMTMVVEDIGNDCKQERISVPREMWDEMRDFVDDNLKRGILLDLSVDISFGKYSKVRLVDILNAYEINEDGEKIWSLR